jgi:hypothetical protein
MESCTPPPIEDVNERFGQTSSDQGPRCEADDGAGEVVPTNPLFQERVSVYGMFVDTFST